MGLFVVRSLFGGVEFKELGAAFVFPADARAGRVLSRVPRPGNRSPDSKEKEWRHE